MKEDIKRMKSTHWYKNMAKIPTDDIDFRLTRVVHCSCKRQYPFLSQPDDHPEYYTFISLLCECGNIIKMKFPVG